MYKVTVGAPSVAKPSFSTNFPATQNPIGSPWINNGAPANGYTKMRSTPGAFFGTNTGASFDDSYAHLSGWATSYPDQWCQGTFHFPNGTPPNDGNSREVELHLRVHTDTSSGPLLYEIDASYTGPIVVVRWEGAGTFTVSGYNGNMPQAPVEGDQLYAQIVGNVIMVNFIPISTGISSTLGTVNVATDTALSTTGNKLVYSSGDPGAGAFIRPGANNNDIAWSAYSAGAF